MHYIRIFLHHDQGKTNKRVRYYHVLDFHTAVYKRMEDETGTPYTLFTLDTLFLSIKI